MSNVRWMVSRNSDSRWLGRDGEWHSDKRRAARFKPQPQISGTTVVPVVASGGAPRQKGLGLQELIARSKPGECPLCGEPTMPIVAPKWKKPKKTHRLLCGDEACVRAYHIYYGRDRRRKEQAVR